MRRNRVVLRTALVGSCLLGAFATKAESVHAPTESVIAKPAEGVDQAEIAARAKIELGLRLRPSAVDSLWAIEPPLRAAQAELAAARLNERPSAWLDSLAPRSPRYAALREAERRYRAMAAAGGWKALPDGPSFRQGDHGQQVKLLRRRLAAEGYALSAAKNSRLFDEDLRAAVAEFQRRHDLPDDGVLGRRTRAALNIGAKARLCQIQANLERWRWAPRELPAERIEIDIAGAEGRFYQAGAPVLEMKVAVGAAKHPTPMFASRIEAVVFNPPWNVPTSIAAAEILPKAARSPTYLSRNHYVVVGRRLLQLPGADNALGQLKFDLVSPFSVYLHDTPVKSVFARRTRAVSHGCIRLEKPRELALMLLAREGWTPEAVDELLAQPKTRRVALQAGPPLYVFYWTALANPAGDVEFRPDVYGWDAKLLAALAAAPQRAAMPRPEADCARPPA